MLIVHCSIQRSSFNLNPLNVDAPRISGLIEADLHVVGNCLALGEDVTKRLCAQDVPAISENIHKLLGFMRK